jgi:CRISPR-associated protein Cas4
MHEKIRVYLVDLISDLAHADQRLVWLMIIVVISVIVLDSISLVAKQKRKEAGIDKKTSTVSIDGSKTLPVRNYVSEIQGLAGKPDAIILEDGFVIPIERKPLARKLRDRYVAQLLVYMRLIEEFEGKKPPYGYLVLGPNCRKIKIYNSEERQKWLQGMINQMREILEGAPAIPAPHPRKCAKCAVRNSCEHRADVREETRGTIA